MKTKLTKWVYENPESKKREYYYVPIVDLFLVGNHKVGKSVKCYIDSGATFNIFPMEYALAFLGFSKKTVEKGNKLNILGVGGAKLVGYGHKCTIQHPDFKLNNIMVYFVENQPYPLLGRCGFMDKFEKIVFDESNKTLELLV